MTGSFTPAAAEWDQRLDRFADYLCKVVRDSEAEEIVLVGHSSGSFLGTEILARALKRDPALGRHGRRVVLLTLGGNYPIVGSTRPRRISAIICASSRSSLRSTGSTARPQGRNEFLPARSDRKPRHRRRPLRRNPTIVPVRFAR